MPKIADEDYSMEARLSKATTLAAFHTRCHSHLHRSHDAQSQERIVCRAGLLHIDDWAHAHHEAQAFSHLIQSVWNRRFLSICV